jgi:diguanylate cyclase (GGDEF)-like protein/PAS domain S-box-containing protein
MTKKNSGASRRSSTAKAAPGAAEELDAGPIETKPKADEVADREGAPTVAREEPPMILVGIGASAGGLEALKELLAELPQSRSLSYVIAQHLSPTHTSLLRELLRPGTDLAVCDLIDGQAPAPNTIYVTPPNHDVLMRDGVLRLSTPKASVGPKPSVDAFFRSLADSLGENTVGIILSGSGSDGSAGIRAIKAVGGVTIVQDPSTAKFDGMPRAAIQTGAVDMVMVSHKMGEALEGLASTPAALRRALPEDNDNNAYARISSSVRRATGFDLSHYKPSTINRRIHRRMGLRKKNSMEDYAELVRTESEEAGLLARDVLISVTSFFRDPDAFQALSESLKSVWETKQADDVFRVWVPGCATGEEAYTIAILLSELSRHQSDTPEYVIFATDLDEDAVTFARNGVFPETSVEGVPDQLRSRYFERQGRTYQVKKFLRQSMVFASQNVVEDPPFSRVDLISCRNLLIYFNRDIQKRVLLTFHYAMRAGGLLLLGSSESIELHRDLFTTLNKKARVFQRKDASTPNYVPVIPRRFGDESVGSGSGDTEAPGRQRRGRDLSSLSLRFTNLLINEYCPPTVVIDNQDNTVHFSGDLHPFLKFPQGPADLRIFDLVADQFRPELRALLHRCRRERTVAKGTVFHIGEGADKRRIVPVVRPMMVDQPDYVALSFEIAAVPATEVLAFDDKDQRDNLIIAELERELASTRQHLQTVVEELETSNEELQSQSEELQSANEELQSTNEELQTSNEELQSTNEELMTVNDELQNKSGELEAMASDLANVKNSLDYPLLVLDRRLHVTHYNSATERQLAQDHLEPGASVISVDWSIDMEGMLPKFRQVMKTSEPFERLITAAGQRSYQMRAVAYIRSNGDIDGVVLTWIDVTGQREADQRVLLSEARHRASFTSSPIGQAIVDHEFTMGDVNQALRDMVDSPALVEEGSPLSKLLDADSYAAVQREAADIREARQPSAQFDVQYRGRAGTWRWAELALGSIRETGDEARYVLHLRDVDERKRDEVRVAGENHRLGLLHGLSARIANRQHTRDIVDGLLELLSSSYSDVKVSFAMLEGHKLVTVAQVPESQSKSPRKLDLDSAPELRDALLSGGKVVVARELDSDTGPYGGLGKRLTRDKVVARADVTIRIDSAQAGVLTLEGRGVGDLSKLDLETLNAVGELATVSLRSAHSREVMETALNDLAEEKERADVTLGAIADAVVRTDADGLITYVNPMVERLVGKPDQDLLNKPAEKLFDLRRIEGEKGVTSPIRQAMKTGAPVEYFGNEYFIQHPDRRRVFADISCKPLVGGESEVIGAVVVMRDVTEQRLLAEELSFRAQHDALTGLTNRDEFERRLKTAFIESKSDAAEHTVAFIDLDQFKVINDTCGHAAGDEVLRQLAVLIRCKLRRSDTLARLGGDEFGIILDHCELEAGKPIVEEALNAIRDFRFEWDKQTYQITASVGLAPMAQGSESVAAVMSQADAACFMAKEAGRNRLYVSGDNDVELSRRNGEMRQVSRITSAIENNRCELVFEDLVRVDDRETVAYRELLVRMRDEGGQLLSPDQFIPAAERYFLASALDRWVVEHALAYLAEHLEQSPPVTAVNVSGQTIGDRSFIEFVRERLTHYKVPGARFCIEITETAAISHLPETARLVASLGELGVQFALDDFGAGMSSFAYLKNLPVQFIKIDGSFVRSMATNHVDRTMVEVINRVGHEFKLTTIAEHVETAELIPILREIGVDLMQGYEINRPRPLEQ